MGKVVLVTGAARQLGGRFVRRIQRDPEVERVIAVDAVTPPHRLGSAEFVRTDIRQSAIARVLAEHAVDTVVHLAVTGEEPAVRTAPSRKRTSSGRCSSSGPARSRRRCDGSW